MGNKTTTPKMSYAVLLPDNFYIPIAPNPDEPSPFTTTADPSTSFDPPIFTAPSVNPMNENNPSILSHPPDTWPNFASPMVSPTHAVPVSSPTPPAPIIHSTTTIPNEHPHTETPKVPDANTVPVNLETPRVATHFPVHDHIVPSNERNDKVSEELCKE